MILLLTASWAQSVPNGDFDASLADWSHSGTLSHRTSDGAPSPGGYAGLYADDSTEWMVSAEFLVTRHDLGWWARDASYGWEVRDGGAVEQSGSHNPPSSAWEARTAPVAAQCGRWISFYAEQDSEEARVDFDAFALQGPPCDVYSDEDGDGQCEQGLDLDGDGDCAEDGEPVDATVDCDDQDPYVGQGVPEQVASGVDEDCDGLESCFEDTDGDGYGSATVVLTGTDLLCTGAGVADNDDESCEGFDDALDGDGDLVPDGCDGCVGDDAAGDTDGDGYCDDVDECPGQPGDCAGDGTTDDPTVTGSPSREGSMDGGDVAVEVAGCGCGPGGRPAAPLLWLLVAVACRGRRADGR